jgi:hypothetical protein
LIVSLLSALAWTTADPRRFRFTASGRVPDPAPPPGPAIVLPGTTR